MDCISDEAILATRVRDRTAGVILHANVEGESGFAAESRALGLRLAQRQFPIQIAPVGGQQLPPDSITLRPFRRELKALLHDRLELAESVLYQSGDPFSWNLDFYGRCRVGRAAFGTNRIPDGWAERCHALDELWLPSEFHRETFAASGVELNKVHVIPPAVDCEIFRPDRRPLRFRGVPEKSFQFLAIADGMLSSGIDTLVRAFIEEFAPDEDVALVLYCPPKRCAGAYIDFEAEIMSLIETKLGSNLEDIPTIALVMGSLSAEDRAGLFAASHAFVQPARADTTGEHGLEALATQLPVIATGWGPLNDFLTEHNSFPLAIDGLVDARAEEDERFAGHRWAELNLDHLRHQLRYIFTNPEENACRARQGRREVIARFEWNAVLTEWIRNFRRHLG